MELYLEGLDCPNCAEKIRAAAEKHKSVKKADVNFMAKRLYIDIADGADEDAVFGELSEIITSIEPEVKPSNTAKKDNRKVMIFMDGLDSADIAEKIRCAVERHYFVDKSEMNYSQRRLTVQLKSGENRAEAIAAISRIVRSISPKITPCEMFERKGPSEFTLIFEDLDCAECGEKIRSYAEGMNGVSKAEFNFMAKKLRILLSPTGKDTTVEAAITAFVGSVEPEVTVIREGKAAPRKAKKSGGSPMSGQLIARFALTAVFFVLGLIFSSTNYGLFLFLAAYIVIGNDVLIKAFSNIVKGQAFDECFLMSIATLGAFLIGEYPEGVAVMFLYQLGETLQGYAVRKSRDSIAELMDIRPDSAYVKRGGETIMCDPAGVEIGEIIVVKPGEKIPLDGVITSGTTSVDTSALTGESVPRGASYGDEVLSGCVNISGLIELRVTKEFGESTVSKILELVENSAAKKAKTENFITRFAKIYTPCVVGAAVLLAVIPMLIQGSYSQEWVYKALSFLVVSCPCALVISVPLSFFGGIGGASKRGILVKGGNCFESLAKCDNIVFDKTGTLTTGTFAVTETVPAEDIGQEDLIRFAAYAESASNHPAAKAIMKYYKEVYLGEIVFDVTAEEIAGKGVKASYNKNPESKADTPETEETTAEASEASPENNDDITEILAGNDKLMAEYGISGIPEVKSGGTVVYVASDGKYAGYIRISDTLKPDAAAAVEALKKAGMHTVMLTGDRNESAAAIASELGIDEYEAELLPDGKVEKLEKILAGGGITAFVGDGINDAPVLVRADIGIAMGALGSDAAIEAADVVLMTDEPSKIGEAVNISKRTRTIVNQNIVFAIGVKLIILLLTALGFTAMWAAVFGDVGVCLITILNSARTRRYNG